ncbi:unnamed protein product, partial [Allacma fusca]
MGLKFVCCPDKNVVLSPSKRTFRDIQKHCYEAYTNVLLPGTGTSRRDTGRTGTGRPRGQNN